MTLWEGSAVVLSLCGVFLEIQRKVSCWPTNMVASGLYLSIFFQAGLIADAGLQGLFVALSGFGWWQWKRPPREMPHAHLTLSGCILTFWLVVISGVLSGWLLSATTADPAPYADATLSVLSILGTIWMALRLRAAWIVWIVTDSVYVVFFLSRGMGATSLLYMVFTALAIWGWYRWAAPDSSRSPVSLRKI